LYVRGILSASVSTFFRLESRTGFWECSSFYCQWYWYK